MTARPRYAWVVLGAAVAIISMAIGTLFTLGVFLVPIERELGWSRSSMLPMFCLTDPPACGN